MKQNKLIVTASLIATILLAIVLQSFHTYEHLQKQLSQKECHHKYNVTNKEITHQHKNLDHCSVCDFAIGSYDFPKEFGFELYSEYTQIPYFISIEETILSFSGSLYSHRGPPVNSLS